MNCRNLGFILSLIIPGICCAGCGGSNTNGSMTEAQATAFATQVSQVAAQGMVNSTAGTGNSISCAGSSCTVDIPVSYASTCSSGGSMQLAGEVRGEMPGLSGSGMVMLQVGQSITNWSCVSGFVINGDPNLSLTRQFSFVLSNPATLQEMTITGDFDWGTGSSQKCSVNLTTSYNLTGTGTTSGTVCNQSVNASFTIQQP